MVIKRMAKINLWIDHRFGDGADFQKHFERFYDVINNPEKFYE